jgi:PBP1b-binding outer membrane lipoprotein LpoB
MKIIYFKSKFICLLLWILIVLQSCVAYKDTASTLDEAVAANGKALVVKTDGTEFKLIKVEQIDGIYYGSMKTRIGIEKVRLTESDLKRISVLDREASTWGTIGVVVGCLGIIFLMIVGVTN